ncbi:MAG: GNAT family N-acetyltransferase [Vicinamibacterales bacterium]
MIEESASVRLAVQEDVPALVGLMLEFYAEAGLELEAARAGRTFERLLSLPAVGGVWLMLVDNVPAGYAVLTVAFSMEYGALRGFVDDLFVAPRFRRIGLATAALEQIKTRCRALDVRALLVETSLANDAAMGAYRNVGFEKTDRLLLSMPLAPALHEDTYERTPDA